MQAIIDKINALRALSQSSNQHEAASAAARMNALIDKYRISIEQLGMKDDPIDWNHLYSANRTMYWRTHLVLSLSTHYGCFPINVKQSPFATNYMVAGRKSDIYVLKYMFAFISSECERISVAECKGKGRQFAESYRIGFVTGVISKLTESRIEAANGDTSALVKLDSRVKESESFVRNQVTDLQKKSDSGYKSNMSAYSQGRSAGSNLHIGESLESSAPKLLEA